MCCCSCCCCCLHTIGGTIGAVAAGGFKGTPGYSSGQSLFWKSFLATIILTGIGIFATSKGTTVEALVGLGFLVLIAGPLFLLGASLLMLIYLLYRGEVLEAGDYWRHLGRITAGVVVGSIIGLLVMLLPVVLAPGR